MVLNSLVTVLFLIISIIIVVNKINYLNVQLQLLKHPSLRYYKIERVKNGFTHKSVAEPKSRDKTSSPRYFSRMDWYR